MWFSSSQGTIATVTSGRIPPSSQASKALSTPSFIVVSSALRGLSNPRRWRFLVKNSEMEISRCFRAMAWAARPAPGDVFFLANLVFHSNKEPGKSSVVGRIQGPVPRLPPGLHAKNEKSAEESSLCMMMRKGRLEVNAHRRVHPERAGRAGACVPGICWVRPPPPRKKGPGFHRNPLVDKWHAREESNP